MSAAFDLVCFSPLRWDSVLQRPQHLLTRCAREHSVLFVEEPIFGATHAHLSLRKKNGVDVVVPCLPEGCTEEKARALQQQLLDVLLARQARLPQVLWYYTPMALPFTRHLQPLLTVYDCVDELANLAGGPAAIGPLERELLDRADLVFTGGSRLHEHKRSHHPRVHAFPSSVDAAHFTTARGGAVDPADQATLSRPRLGFFGVIDERVDLELLAAIAVARPDWQLIMLGPTVKIDPATLPRFPNLHWLGSKSYAELPRYIAGWDVTLLPFACNEANRFISPIQTPEYLAAGKPVVSTPIWDVVHPYGDMDLVSIAATPQEFITAVERTMREPGLARQRQADGWLANLSWDRTWADMERLIVELAASKRLLRQPHASPSAGLGHSLLPWSCAVLRQTDRSMPGCI